MISRNKFELIRSLHLLNKSQGIVWIAYSNTVGKNEEYGTK